ncbi:trypsin-like peptidase domain-containing protein [Natronolimnohabitans sp. A-GB9]|uniref:S1C family serine protease n=1 Tax=Natronolimnohabitans sp. A-GB9 TaxID=3069757 RepID=UPI0027AE684B|nr:trypsin-like peptidase domain-containing protein [Natronolimnohabitans sp. A-GB9]MDQ2049702.1 trypsin-like peptidase domain-containing protein [Natronolimnohabitans sp. A-GB9]
MPPDHPRVTRRRLLQLSAGAATATALGGGVAAASAQEEPEFEGEGAYAEIYEETIDDVVLVNVFGTDGPGEDGIGGLGSGFVVDDYVVTNHHVVGGASEVELQFVDEQWRTADVAGTDVHSDLAVLEVDDIPDGPDGLSFTTDEPTIGAEVLALGNPLGLDASISQGIISGIDRSLPSPTGFSIPAAIQTDAPVNPGNSGGPLVNLEGDVAGVVFAGAGQTIGFAISAALADRVVPTLVEDGEYDHAYMGVSVFPVGPLVADANDLEEPRGVLIMDIVSDSPADGVLEPADETTTVDGDPVPTGGDVIVAIDDNEIPNQDLLSSTIALETSPGDTIDVEVVRDGERETVELTLEERPEIDMP